MFEPWPAYKCRCCLLCFCFCFRFCFASVALACLPPGASVSLPISCPMTRLRQPRARPEAGAGARRASRTQTETETHTDSRGTRVRGRGLSSLQILVSTQLSFLALPGYDTTEKFVIMVRSLVFLFSFATKSRLPHWSRRKDACCSDARTRTRSNVVPSTL